MNLEIILWGIAGYISDLIFRLTRPTRIRSGWDFVVNTALFSVFDFILANLIVVSGQYWLPTQLLEQLKNILSVFIPRPFFHLVIGIVLAAPLIGLLASYVWTLGHKRISKMAKFISGKYRNLEFADTFFATCHELLGHLALVTLTSGKVYIGVLVEATQDPNESQRFIKLTPITSGYRKTDTLQLVLNTNYMEDVKDAKSWPKRDLLIPVNQISTLAAFDTVLHNRFVQAGITIVGNERTP